MQTSQTPIGADPLKLLEEIRSFHDADLLCPDEQYKKRSAYRSIVLVAIDTGWRWPLYDTWAMLSEHRTAAPRGFFLDLWDILVLEMQRKSGGGDITAVQELLEAFVCAMIPDFASLLGLTTIPDAPFWVTHVAAHARRATKSKGKDNTTTVEDEDCQSLLHLVATLYPHGHPAWGATAADQVRQFERCSLCLTNQWISSRVWAEGRAVGDQSEETLAEALLFFYQAMKHHKQVDLRSLATQLAGTPVSRERLLGSAETSLAEALGKGTDLKGAESALLALLRAWAAENPFLERLLRDRTGFSFTHRVPSRQFVIPQANSLKQQILIVGPMGVGKTSLMMASRDLSRKWGKGPPTLKICHLNETREKEEIERMERAWRTGQPCPTEDVVAYAETPTRGMCAFTFFDIPGEAIQGGPQQRVLQKHIKDTPPAALIIMGDPSIKFTNHSPEGGGGQQDKALKALKNLISLVPGSSARPHEHRDLPIYFVVNKADKLVPDRVDVASNLVGAFRRALSLESAAECHHDDEAARPERFFSLRGFPLEPPEIRPAAELRDRDGTAPTTTRAGEIAPSASLADEASTSEMQWAKEVQRIIRGYRPLCLAPPYQRQLLEDVVRFAPLIGHCLENGFENISLVYTRCLPPPPSLSPEEIGKLDQHDQGTRLRELAVWYRGIEDVWEDLRNYVSAASRESRKTFFRKKFVDQPRQQVSHVNSFAERHMLHDPRGLDAGVLDRAFERKSSETHPAFARTIRSIVKQSDGNDDLTTVETRFYEELVPSEVRAALKCLDRQTETFENALQAGLEAILVELGIAPSARLGQFKDLTGLRGADSGLLAEAIREQRGLTPAVQVGQKNIRYRRIFGALDTGCVWRDDDHSGDNSVAALKIRAEEDRTAGEVFKEAMVTKANDLLDKLAESLAGYDSLYPQLAFELLEVDEIKRRVLPVVTHDLQPDRIDLLKLLGTIWNHVRDTEYKPECIRVRIESRLVLRAMENEGFRVTTLLSDPDGFMEKLIRAIRSLDGAMKLRRAFWQLPLCGRRKCVMDFEAKMREAHAEMENVQQITDELACTPLWTALERIEERHRLYNLVRILCTGLRQRFDKQGLKFGEPNLHYAPPALSSAVAPNISTFNKKLAAYRQELVRQLIRERGCYLQESGWLNELPENLQKFVAQAIQQKHNVRESDQPLALADIVDNYLAGAQVVLERANWVYDPRQEADRRKRTEADS